MTDTAPRVVMIVPNDVTNDVRVKKMAVTVAAAGCDVVVVGWSGAKEPWKTRTGDVVILRVGDPAGGTAKGSNLRLPGFLDGRISRPVISRQALLRVLGYGSSEEYAVACERRRVAKQTVATDVARLKQRIQRRSRGKRSIDKAATNVLRTGLRWRRLRAKVRDREFKLRQRIYKGEPLPSVLGLRRASDSSGAHAAPVWERTHRVIPVLQSAFGPVIDRLQPDLVHCHDVLLLATAKQAVERASRAGRHMRWIYDAHEYVRGFTKFNQEKLEALLALEEAHIRAADHVITVSDKLAACLERDYDLSDRPTVVLNAPPRLAFDSSDSETIRHRLGLDEKVPLLVYSGQVKPLRGVHTLVEAMPLLPGLHVALVTNNQGEYVDSLLEKAAETGCLDRLHLVPYVEPQKVTSFIRDATAGVHTMLHYGNAEVALPNKLFEYMHAHVPVVMSDTEAIREVVEALGVGEVFAAGDPEDLAGAVRRVLSERDAYLARLDGNEEALRRFSWEQQEQVLVGVYHGLLGDRVHPVEPALRSLKEDAVLDGRGREAVVARGTVVAAREARGIP